MRSVFTVAAMEGGAIIRMNAKALKNAEAGSLIPGLGKIQIQA
jgi:hypothetical protein